MIYEFLEVLLKLILLALLAAIAINLVKIEGHQAYIESYLRDSEKLEVQIINP